METGRTGAGDELVPEISKTDHLMLIEVIAEVFDCILHGDMEVPESWRSTKLKLIFKKGDPELSSNSRPISIIPVFAKLYNAISYNRIRDTIDGQLADEQYGSTKGWGCADAIHFLRTVVEK